MNTSARLGLTAGLMVAAGFFGYWFGEQHAVIFAVDQTKAALAKLTEDSARLRREVAQLQAENERLSGQAATSSATAAHSVDGRAMRMARLRAELEKRKNQNRSDFTQFVGFPTAELTQPFVAMFDLTDTEAETINRALSDGKKKINELVAANAAVVSNGDTFVVSIKPFANGAEIYDEVMDAFARTLGPERNALFMALADDQLAWGFNHFGAEEKTLTLSQQSFGTETPRLSLDIATKMPQATAHTIADFADISVLAQSSEYGWLSPLAAQWVNLPVRAQR